MRNIITDTNFAQQNNHMIKKRDQIISHKFGTHMTKYVKYAKATDQVNWNNIWWYVALKEMKNVKV